jgi:hypothetical protein
MLRDLISQGQTMDIQVMDFKTCLPISSTNEVLTPTINTTKVLNSRILKAHISNSLKATCSQVPTSPADPKLREYFQLQGVSSITAPEFLVRYVERPAT